MAYLVARTNPQASLVCFAVVILLPQDSSLRSERTVARKGEKTDMIKSNLQYLNVDFFDRIVMDLELIVMCRAAPEPLRMWRAQRWKLRLLSK